MGYLNYSMAMKVGLQTLKTWVLAKFKEAGRNQTYSYYYEEHVKASYLMLHF
jgi:hypothetical protein